MQCCGQQIVEPVLQNSSVIMLLLGATVTALWSGVFSQKKSKKDKK